MIVEEILLYHSKKAQKYYVSNKKKYPSGMLHLTYGDYREHKNTE